MQKSAQTTLQHQSTLYDPRYEHDNCGIGFVARINGQPGHDILNMAIIALGNQAHRGAVAADANTGDGSGVLTQIPRALIIRDLERQGIMANPKHIAVGMLFLPQDAADAKSSCRIISQTLNQRGLQVLGWREVPINARVLGQRAKETMPRIRQVIIGCPEGLDEDNYERTLLLARKEMEATFKSRHMPVYIPSLSSRTIVYKGLLIGTHLGCFYLDLRDPTYETALAVYHQRYSTNTFPTWERAQPFRMVSHNGEINTLQGNINWTRARQSKLHFPEVPGKKEGTVNIITSVIEENGSDSAMFDNALEVLVLGGRDIRHAITMMAPEAWEKMHDMDPALRSFYQYHACLEEPWDGPAALTFSDGHIAGTSLDRNGLRPARYCITDDGLVISGSEAGVVPLEESRIIRKGRLGPGQMIVVDTRSGRFSTNEEVKQSLAARKPYATWVSQHLKTLDNLPTDAGGLSPEDAPMSAENGLGSLEKPTSECSNDRVRQIATVAEQVATVAGQVATVAGQVAAVNNDSNAASVAGQAISVADEVASVADKIAASEAPRMNLIERNTLQKAFGYTSEELSVLLKPMMQDGREPVGSMGDDTPLAVLSQLEYGRPLFHYFKQRFAEVTNPPIDPLREGIVMSLHIRLGARLDILEETPEHAHLLQLESPILNDAQLATIRANTDPRLRTVTLNALMPVAKGGTNIRGEMELRQAVERLCNEAEKAAYRGATLLIISDRAVDANHAPIPSLLAVGAVHHHLIRTEWRGRVSLLVESGDPREVHDMACLIGYGAKAINPYLALSTIRAMAREKTALLPKEAERNYIQALEKGILKIMSKMGISPLESYCGAQIFEAIGLNKTLVDSCFTGTASRVGGIGFEKLARDVLARHRAAFAPVQDNQDDQAGDNRTSLIHPGFYKFKKNGEYHAYGPAVVRALHDAVMPREETNDLTLDGLDADGNISMTGYMRYRVYADIVNNRPPSELRDLLDFVPTGIPIQLDEVEPIERILARFSTAAMSHGAMSRESHEVLSIAMNRLGGKGNSGEGGEDVERYNTERNSRIKQIASGRFGVTPIYLMSADEIQIKMAQGSKPGEGGHLPGHKVSPEIARNRHTTPGVALISPPPHHDIYSIEDLAQLIYDLKRLNPGAEVSVKLVALSGVGTIAAGVAKGYADGILISGSSGGTGASPLSSIKHAGMPWELGLAETQQTLMINGLRGRIRLRVDGGFQTGRDVVIAAMLGADEFSFGTIAMIAEGCRMARVCHNNTCPVGIATQRLDLREKFPGQPEMVMAFFRYLAHEVREILASLGLRSLDEAIGHTDLLVQKHTDLPNADNLDLTPMLAICKDTEHLDMHHMGSRNLLPPEDVLDDRILHDARYALSGRGSVDLSYAISNRDRTVGARISGVISQMYGEQGMPPDTIRVKLRGSSGQSFGAFLAPGMHLLLIGEVNDYVGKGMAGGKIVVRPGEYARSFVWHENVIAGNTILYGATGGELYLAGRAGERFAVRNSGALAVVEGVGDHGCEYMTGGKVLILGTTGYNFGAGMTGGVAYVLDEEERLPTRYNNEFIRLDRLNTHDEVEIQTLLRQHHGQTTSPRAAHLLEHWNSYRGLFWRVMSKELVAKLETTTNEGQEAQ